MQWRVPREFRIVSQLSTIRSRRLQTPCTKIVCTRDFKWPQTVMPSRFRSKLHRGQGIAPLLTYPVVTERTVSKKKNSTVYRLVTVIEISYKYLSFFNWLFIVALTARSYRDCHWFSVWECYFDILNLRSHTWDVSLSIAYIYRAVSSVVTGPRPRCEQPWVQATPSVMKDICRAVSNVVTGPLPTISIMRPGNLIYELLYEFKLHCHLLVNLSIRSPPFWQQWFQITRNCKH